MRSAANAVAVVSLLGILASVVLAQPTSAPYLWPVHTVAWVALMLVITRHDLSQLAKVLMVVTVAVVVGWTMATSAGLYTVPISDDVYRYIWDGHVTTSGINPYAYPPNSPAVAGLAFSPRENMVLPTDVKFAHMTTIYPPGGQLLFAAITVLGGTTLSGWMLAWQLVLIGLATTMVLVIRRDRRWIALVVLLNPILVIHGLREPHIDAAMALISVIAIALWDRQRPAWSGIALACAIAMKYLAGMAVPLMIVARRRASVIAVGTALLGVALLYAPFMGHNVAGNLGTFAAKFRANSFVAEALIGAGMKGTTTHSVLLACMALAACAVLWRYRRAPAYAVATATMAMLCLSPVAHPWYFALPVALCALTASRAAVAATLFTPLYLVGWHYYTNGGAWKEDAAVLLAEWLPIAVCVVADVVRPPRWLTSERPSE